MSNSIKPEIFDQYILDAQIQDLAPLLGEDLFMELLTNSEEHEELMVGGAYSVGEKVYTNVGLECVLSHYAYARYILFGSVVDTPFSLVEKINPSGSTPVSTQVKRDLYKLNQDTAFTYFGNVKNYMMRKGYAKYFKHKGCEPMKNGIFRINKIG